jgi:hypothetical protein
MDDEGQPIPPADEPAAAPVLNYATPRAEETVLIARFSDAFEAELARSKLEAENVRVYAETAMVSGADVYTGKSGQRIRVHADDVDAAVASLRQTPARQALVPPYNVVDTGGLTCPNCSSPDVAPMPLPESFKLWCVLLLGLPLLLVRRRVWRCRACGRMWTPE